MRNPQLLNENGWQMTSGELREALNLPKKLPENSETLLLRLGKEYLVLRPFVAPTEPRSRRTKSSKHRLFVRCWECNKLIPAGRIQQHYIGH